MSPAETQLLKMRNLEDGLEYAQAKMLQNNHVSIRIEVTTGFVEVRASTIFRKDVLAIKDRMTWDDLTFAKKNILCKRIDDALMNLDLAVRSHAGS